MSKDKSFPTVPIYSDEGLLYRLFSFKVLPHCLCCCCFVHRLLMWICALLISKIWAALNGIKSYHHHQTGLIWESRWESEGWNQVMSFIGKCYCCCSLKADETVLECVCLCSSFRFTLPDAVGVYLRWSDSEWSQNCPLWSHKQPLWTDHDRNRREQSRWNTDHNRVVLSVNTP